MKTTYVQGPWAPAPRAACAQQAQLLRKAAECAHRSNMSHRHGCVIVDGRGKVMASGHNFKGAFLCHHFSIHAEVHALSKLKKAADLSACDMYIVRISNRRGHVEQLRCSMPCQACMQAINRAGLRNVYFSAGAQ